MQTSQTAVEAISLTSSDTKESSRGPVARRWGLYIGVVIAALIVWHLISLMTIPLFLPGPILVGEAVVRQIEKGTLQSDVRITFFRVLSGWILGAMIAIPVGLAAGRLPLFRGVTQPFTNFFRFIPPIALITLAVIWLGIGDPARISIIAYSSLFIVFLSTLHGAASVDEVKLRAARSLGASGRHQMITVIVPASLPSIITGMRAGMGNAFMAAVAAELIGADSGVGYMIINAGVVGRTDIAIAGLFALGAMGFVADYGFRLITSRIAFRFGIVF